jgi:hypothetical protein
MYICAFGGDFRQAKEVVSIIIRILLSQARVLTPRADWEAEGIDEGEKKKNEERLAQRLRLE